MHHLPVYDGKTKKKSCKHILYRVVVYFCTSGFMTRYKIAAMTIEGTELTAMEMPQLMALT